MINLKSASLVLAAALASPVASVSARDYSVSSPDGALTMTVNDDAGLKMSLSRDGRTLLNPSEIGMNIRDAKTPLPMLKVKSVKTRNGVSEEIDAPRHHTPHFTLGYNEATLRLSDGTSMVVRVMNDGAAYRFIGGKKGAETVVDSETIDLALPSPDTRVLLSYSTNDKNPYAMAFQNFYHDTPIAHAKDKLAFLPATVDYGDGLKMTILESDVEAYPGMFLAADTVAGKLQARFAPYPKTYDYYTWRKQQYVTSTEDFIATSTGTRNYPWRIFAVTTDDRQMPVNNLVYGLASPSRLTDGGDQSWIKGGKVAWDWWNDWGLAGVPFKAGINMDTYRYFIDFASEHGIEYVVLDEGWYDSSKGDLMNVIPELDLQGLIDYGKERGVGIVLWTVFNQLDDNLEEACSTYKKMGVKGFKVDFLDRNDQTAAEMTYRIAKGCADHGLMLDLHGFYTPTGLERTFPNIINYESLFGMEEMKWSEPTVDMPRYDVTFPYIRMMAGPVDYTPGAMTNATRSEWRAHYYNPMSQGTRCHQMATYIVHDSPFTMLCDAPTNYLREEPTVEFITSVPTTFDATEIIDGRLGEYIVTARRSGASYFVGAMTDWDPRDITVDFSFLPEGTNYQAIIFTDGANADKQAEDHVRRVIEVNRDTRLPVRLASGGGMAMRLDPRPAAHTDVTAVPAEKRNAIDPFYNKYIESDGFYVVSSEQVSDEALHRAADIVSLMMLKMPEVKKHMVNRGCHLLVIGKDEMTCDIPEYKHVCTDDPDSIAYINWRARGFGGAPEDDLSSGCGEENLLALPTDKYEGENILIHEFAHLIHQIGLNETDPSFQERLVALYNSAKEKGLWEGTYALSNPEEYFAESVQSFFNCNRFARPANGIHNWVNRRAKLRAYDPDMYALLTEYFYEIDIPIANKIHP